MLDAVRCHRVRRGRAGQALVETALLFPVLLLLIMGSADLGRIFYYAIEVTNAAREGARQGTYWDPRTSSNVYDSYAAVLTAVQREASDLSLSVPASAPTHCLGGASNWPLYYPTQPNTGYVFICFDDQDGRTAPAASTVAVTILYNFAPVTPLAHVVGSDTVHVATSTTMQVQASP